MNNGTFYGLKFDFQLSENYRNLAVCNIFQALLVAPLKLMGLMELLGQEYPY